MPLVKAECPNCGGILDVDSLKDASICSYCGTPYIVEKAINNYNTNVTNNHVYNNPIIVQEDGFQKLLNAAEGYIRLCDFSSAIDTYNRITKEYPQKFEGWYGLICAQIAIQRHNGGLNEKPCYPQHIEYAKKVATETQLAELNKTLADYKRDYEACLQHTRKKVWFQSFDEWIHYIKKNNYRYSSDFGGYAKIVYESGKLKFKTHTHGSTWLSDCPPEEDYEYIITGYNSSTNSFLFAPRGTYTKKEYKSASWFRDSGYVTKTISVNCNIQLTVEDYDSNGLYQKYHSTSGGLHDYQYFMKYTHDGKTEDIFFHEYAPYKKGLFR